MNIYLATQNAHKLQEVADILSSTGLPLNLFTADALGGMPKVEETGQTFADNARLKALALVEELGEEDWALADDSGLCVDALDGAPGIYSARYAGLLATDALNNARLLSELEGVSAERRRAHFTCCLVLLNAQGEAHQFEGHCAGAILTEPRGAHGFGYDPLFQPDGYAVSMAELKPAEKNRISHRARALQKFAEWLLVQRQPAGSVAP